MVRAHHGVGLYLGQDDGDFYAGLPGIDESAPPVVSYSGAGSPGLLAPAPAPALPTLAEPASNLTPFGTDAAGNLIFLGPNGYTTSTGQPMTPAGVVTPLDYASPTLNAQAQGVTTPGAAPRVAAPPSASALQALTSALMAPVPTVAKPAAVAAAAPAASIFSGTSGTLLLFGGGLLLLVMMMGRK